MPIMGLRLLIRFWRCKGECRRCKKARAEHVGFIAEETPHLTQDYAWWVGRLCEIAAVSRAAELVGQDETTTWRLDLARMKRMLVHYKIPDVTKISVDEVYARKKPKHPGEDRDRRFFTVISDLETRRVIWVAESRKKEALDQFFLLIGKGQCHKIEVVATDQHDDYAASVREHCPRAVHVLDRFHLMQNFEVAVNETRKTLHEEQGRGSEIARLTRGKYRFLFVKKACRRTDEERAHIDDVLRANEYFAKLELIKERMLSFFDQPDEGAARTIFDELGDWIWQAGFKPLMDWYKRFEGIWSTVKNYFKYRVSSALSEGHNSVIKMLKRRAFGYRNMEYFRLKIMQVCGYLNSRYIPTVNSLTCT
jgi:transposase